MKMYYDKEFNILKDVHEMHPSECLIVSDDEGTANYYNAADVLKSILDDKRFEKWIDNSKSSFPPDLINSDEKLIMEVMRVDDHSSDGKNNPVLAGERKLSKEAKPFLDMCPPDTPLIIHAKTNLPTELDHNYKFYYLSFQRTVGKHLSKLNTYKKNYPDSKVIFLVFDETSGVYFKKIESSNIVLNGNLHIPFFDNKFLNTFINSDLDYLLWYCPYNHYDSLGDHLTLPRLIFFDIKNARNGKLLKTIDYDENKMVSNEK